MHHRFLAGFCALSALSGLAIPARADLVVDHSVGVKLLAGADIWTTPEGLADGDDGLGFRGNGGGMSYGALAYYDLRLIKLIGLEAGLNYQLGNMHRNVSVNGVDITEELEIKSLRLPLLAKLNVPLGLGRLWFGLGPEFTLSQSAEGHAEGGGQDPDYTIREVKPTFLTFGTGLVIDVPGVGLEIPVEFRGSKNLDQPGDYLDRAEGERLRAESSWVLRLGAGLGVSF